MPRRTRADAKLEGMDDLKARLRALPLHERIESRRQLMESAALVAADAQSRAPYLTGELRDSIVHRLIEGGAAAVVGTNLWRAHFAEFGTKNAPAHPFLHPALRANKLRHVREMARAMDKAHRKATR